ncbi:hypothetical protein KAR91_01050 [Candidatus Pacearchaeota archaeon]|nr:hypothetical protein [Candidatus Pacearchaeota archaeon]
MNDVDEDSIPVAKFREILHEELDEQRKQIFRYISDAVGYDVGDPEELKDIRKDLWMIRTTRLRSERFKATGERIFFIFFWGSILSSLIAGIGVLIKNKVLGHP